jgi:hypothetical protein
MFIGSFRPSPGTPGRARLPGGRSQMPEKRLNRADNMKPIVTKAELSRMLGVSRARVAQYAALGLPTRDDGRLNTVLALQWVVGNILPPDEGGGAVREARLLLWELTGGNEITVQ